MLAKRMSTSMKKIIVMLREKLSIQQKFPNYYILTLIQLDRVNRNKLNLIMYYKQINVND